MKNRIICGQYHETLIQRAKDWNAKTNRTIAEKEAYLRAVMDIAGMELEADIFLAFDRMETDKQSNYRNER